MERVSAFIARGQMRRKIALTILLLTAAASTRADRLDDYVNGLMKMQQVPGAVVIVLRDGSVLEQRAYGLANIEFNVPMTVEKVFAMSAITGLFTSTAVFGLVQDGKLRLNDRISTLVSGLPHTWRDITILECLNHTSGLPNLYDGQQTTLPIAFNPAEAIQKLAAKPLLSKPGEKMSYSQTDFLLLRLVIEKASGVPFDEFMTEHLFRPLGLSSAQFADARDIVSGKATLYSRFTPDASRLEFARRSGFGGLSDHQMWTVPYFCPESARAGAGLVMSALDLAKFDSALSAKKVLSRDSLGMMWTPTKLSNGAVGDYTAGWRQWGQDAHVPEMIVGQYGGTGVEYVRLIGGQYSVIVLTNCPDADVHAFTMGILNLYTYTAPILIAQPER